MISKILSNKSGFSLIEALVAAAILGTGSYIILTGLDMLKAKKTDSFEKMDQEIILNSIVDDVRSNVAYHKIDFAADSGFLRNSSYQDVHDSLHMRWNSQGMLTPEQCPGCPGRIGYVVKPYKLGNKSISGLYEVIIRMTHRDLFPNDFKQYQFIVRGP